MRILNISLAGIDIICSDIREPEFWVNEVNTSPAFGHHLRVRNQECRREVAEEALKLMFRMP
jgi:D-alanine-D-alanine ligase-like ATP-grasp enzyme